MHDSGTTACFHCSDPLPENNPHAFSATLAGDTQWFCCPACRSVAETIHGLGLTAYYTQRDQKPVQPAAVHQDWSDMDLPDIQASFLHQHSDGSVEADLLVAGIHCASCCWLIEHRLQTLPGVSEAHAQFGQQKVRLRWQPARTPASAIFAALAAIGYRAVPWHESNRQLHARTQQTALLKRAGVAGIVAMQIHMIAMGNYLGEGGDLDPAHQQLMNSFALLLSLPVWFYAAQPFFTSAWRHLRQGFLGMDLPVAIAIVTAAIVSIHSLINHTNNVYFDSIAMFVFLLLGARFLEARARSKLSIHTQAAELPQSCTRIIQGGTEKIATQALTAGDRIIVNAGETVVADGIVMEGSAAVEQALITGEYRPVHRHSGDAVLAGSIVRSGSLHIRVRQWGNNTQIAQLQARVEAALDTRKCTTSYDVIAQYFTPVVLLVAAGTAAFWLYHDPGKAVVAVMAVLVASCPCALSIAIPAVQAAAISTLKQQGILITSANTLLRLPDIRCFAFDKTGSLTEGHFSILQTTLLQTIPAEECLAIASAMEAHSTHPIATAFFAHQPRDDEMLTVSNSREHAHLGIEGDIRGAHYRIGSPDWLGIAASNTGETEVILANQQGPMARYTLGDSIREDAGACIRALEKNHIHCAILSGDASGHVQSVATVLQINDFRNACSPDEKVTHIKTLRNDYGCIAMLGDGINDGPVLAEADISLSLADASHIARLSADVLLLNNRLSDIATLLATAKNARIIARQNVAWAFAYNICILPVAAAGMLSPAAAAIGMASSSLLVTFNALRLFKKTRRKTSGKLET